MSRIQLPITRGTRKIFSWESSNGVDHFCHATVYFDLARKRFAGSGDTEIVEDEGVKPEDGKVVVATKSGTKMVPIEEMFNRNDGLEG